MAWWVAAHWAHCGVVVQLDDGAIVYETPYADPRPLLGWVLGLGDEAELLEPAALRERIAGELAALEQLLDAPAPARSGKAPAPVKAQAPRRRRADDDLKVEVDRFTRLTALTSYLLRRCKDDEALLEVAEVRADLGVSAEELRADVRLLNLVNFGADGALLYAEFEGRSKLSVFCDLAGPALRRPARLSPLQADTLLLAIELVGNHLPTASGAALESAREKIRQARGGAPALAGSDLLHPADAVLTDVNRAIVDHRLLAIEYWTEGTDRVTERLVEPYLLVHSRGEWYYVCWCRTAGGTRVFRVATTKKAALLDETFAPREDVELDVYRREGIPTSGACACLGAAAVVQPGRGPLDRRAPAGGAAARWIRCGEPALRGRPLARCPPAALRRRNAPARTAGGGRGRARRRPPAAGTLRVTPTALAALPVAVDGVLYGAYLAAWGFFAYGPQLIICMLFAWSACRRARGDLLTWPTKGFLWSLLPFVGVAVMWWISRRETRRANGGAPDRSGPSGGTTGRSAPAGGAPGPDAAAGAETARP